MFYSVKAQVLCVFVLLLYAQSSQADNLIDKLRDDAFTQIEKQLSAFIQKHDDMQKRISNFVRISHTEFQEEACYNTTIQTFGLENDKDLYGNKELLDIQHYFKLLMDTRQQSATSEKLETEPCKCSQIDEAIKQTMSEFSKNLTEELNTNFESNERSLKNHQELTYALAKTQNASEIIRDYISTANSRIEQLHDSLTKTQNTSDLIGNKLDNYIETIRTSLNEQRELIKTGLPDSCAAVIGRGNGPGYYQILIFNKPTPAFCDGLGRMMIQHQMKGSEDFFNRGWSAYKTGFGEPKSQYWFGLENLHLLTTSRRYELHMIMTDFDNVTTQAIYDHFEIGGESDMYRLNKVGGFSGNQTVNRLQYHVNMPFTTLDKDNNPEKGKENCAVTYKCGWWYAYCYRVNLNSKVRTSETEDKHYVLRWHLETPLKEATMYLKLH